MMLCGTFHHGLIVTAVIVALSCGVGVRRAPTTVRWRAVTRPSSTKAAVKAGTLTSTWRAPRLRGIQRQRSILVRMRSRRAVVLGRRWRRAPASGRHIGDGSAAANRAPRRPPPPRVTWASSRCWPAASSPASVMCQSTRPRPRTEPPLRSAASCRKIWLATGGDRRLVAGGDRGAQPVGRIGGRVSPSGADRLRRSAAAPAAVSRRQVGAGAGAGGAAAGAGWTPGGAWAWASAAVWIAPGMVGEASRSDEGGDAEGPDHGAL